MKSNLLIVLWYFLKFFSFSTTHCLFTLFAGCLLCLYFPSAGLCGFLCNLAFLSYHPFEQFQFIISSMNHKALGKTGLNSVLSRKKRVQSQDLSPFHYHFLRSLLELFFPATAFLPCSFIELRSRSKFSIFWYIYNITHAF